MAYGAALAIAVGLGLPIAVVGGAIAQSRVGSAALEGMARQPELADKLRLTLILCLALIESLVIYALLGFLLLFNKLPSVMDVISGVNYY